MLTLTFPGVFLRNVGTHSDILLPALRSQSYKLCMFLFLNLAASAKKKKKEKVVVHLQVWSLHSKLFPHKQESVHVLQNT